MTSRQLKLAALVLLAVVGHAGASMAALYHYHQQQQQPHVGHQQIQTQNSNNNIGQYQNNNQPQVVNILPPVDIQPSQIAAAQQQQSIEQQQQLELLAKQQQPPDSQNQNQNQIQSQSQNLNQNQNQPLRSNSQRSIADGQQQQQAPHPIFRFQGYALNGTSVKLIWNLNVSAPQPDYFDIDYGPIPDATNLVTISKLNKTSRDYTINQLTPETHYQFTLRSYNRELDFEPKLFVLRTPSSSAASIRPQNVENAAIMPLGVKAEGKSNTSIQIIWTEQPKPDNLFNVTRVNTIRWYTVNNNNNNNNQRAAGPAAAAAAASGNSTDAGPAYFVLNTTGAREGRATLQKLKPATEYAFAIKTAYWSPDMKKLFTQSGFSMDTVAKTFDLEPSPPRNFSIRPIKLSGAATDEPAQPLEPSGTRQASHSAAAAAAAAGIKLELTWLPPESPNGQLRGYLLLYSNSTDPDAWLRQDIENPKIDSWNISNVRPGLTHYFKMRAINQRGQSQDSEVRSYTAPLVQGQLMQPPIPHNNLLLLIIICMVAILFLLFLIVSRLACRTRQSGRKSSTRKGSLNGGAASQQQQQQKLAGGGGGSSLSSSGVPKLNGFASTNSSSTVTARVGTLARRRTNQSAANNNSNNERPDFWISAMDQQQQQQLDSKSNMSEKSELNMAMVSIQRDSPQFATTQLAPTLPEYRFATGQQQQALMDQQQQQQQLHGHYHPGLMAQFGQSLGYDQMDNATASALMTLSKRQQQQMQKYQIQFASTGAAGPTQGSMAAQQQQQQAPSPHQQPPPPPPLNIEQQQQQHHHQNLYGTHQPVVTSMANTRSLRMHRPTLYDPVSGSFVQSQDTGGPPNYSSHMHQMGAAGQTMTGQPQFNSSQASNTLQFHPNHSSTLLSRRSTNTLRSFQTSNGAAAALYGQFVAPPPPPGSMSASGGVVQQPQQLLQSHQAVINQLNNSTYPSLPLKHVSAVRPQIMSSLEDQIEMELAEKEPITSHHQSQDNSQQQQQQQQQQHHQQQQQQQHQQQQQKLQ